MMSALLTPPATAEPDESTEPPPSTRSRASQSPQPCLPPRQHQLLSPPYTPGPLALCIAKTSTSARASSVSRASLSAAAGTRTRVERVSRDWRGAVPRRKTSAPISRGMRMGDTATSGFSTTSASRTLLRRDMEGFSSAMSKIGEERDWQLSTMDSGYEHMLSRTGGEAYRKYEHLHHDRCFLPRELFMTR